MNAEQMLVELLMERGFHIACAESCTGGLLCGALVNVPNASRVLDASFITYANEAKIKYLGVSPSVLEQFGAVSEEVAGQMAFGVAKEASCEVGVAVSGIAGPTGGTDQKPVGTVCFGFSVNGHITTSTQYFSGLSRNRVREAAVHYALSTLSDLLRNS